MVIKEKICVDIQKIGSTPDVCAIIAAAGSSSRMNGINKIFAQISGMPVIARTLAAYNSCNAIKEIVIAAKETDIPDIQRICEQYDINKLHAIVSGGDTRSCSVKNALSAVSSDCKFIAIADGARPLTSHELIEAAIDGAMRYSAAAVAVNVTDTIKVGDESGFISATPDRSALWAAQTPQVFDKQLYTEAVNSCGGDFTDDCALIEKHGVRVKLVHGDYKNIKITTPVDLIIAEAILTEGA